jgi:hypothetical protein
VPHPALTSARFQIPLVKPDVRFSRIRLPFQRIHAFAHEKLDAFWTSRNRPSLS